MVVSKLTKEVVKADYNKLSRSITVTKMSAKPCQTSKMKLFAKAVNGFQLVIRHLVKVEGGLTTKSDKK